LGFCFIFFFEAYFPRAGASAREYFCLPFLAFFERPIDAFWPEGYGWIPI
jgi:hypothetical protein